MSRWLGGPPIAKKEGKSMIDMLVSLNADLASSIAFRYACRLTELVDIHLQTIHVEEVEKEGYPPGSGWVRSTWEKGLLQTAQEEISQLINTEKSTCPPLNAAIIRIGDRDEELLQEIKNESYDLLLEGVLGSFDEQLFYKKLRSKLYKQTPCPILLVKNLVNPAQVALLMGEHKDVKPVVSTFLRIFSKSKVTVDLVYFEPEKNSQEGFKKKFAELAGSSDGQVAGRILDEAKTLLAEDGWKPEESWVIRNKPKKIGEMIEEYGLVGVRVPRSSHKHTIVLDVLSRVPSATLLSKY
jgi:hypothetical protein